MCALGLLGKQQNKATKPTSETEEPDRFTLTLRALPGWPTPPLQRLRAALKRLLRNYGLRCTEARPIRESKNCRKPTGLNDDDATKENDT